MFEGLLSREQKLLFTKSMCNLVSLQTDSSFPSLSQVTKCLLFTNVLKLKLLLVYNFYVCTFNQRVCNYVYVYVLKILSCVEKVSFLEFPKLNINNFIMLTIYN